MEQHETKFRLHPQRIIPTTYSLCITWCLTMATWSLTTEPMTLGLYRLIRGSAMYHICTMYAWTLEYKIVTCYPLALSGFRKILIRLCIFVLYSHLIIH